MPLWIAGASSPARTINVGGRARGRDSNRSAGEPESRNIYAALAAGKEVDKLPLTLGEALNRLQHDEVIRQALPDEMYRVFMHYKRDEWEKFLATVTEWDVRTYLDCLP